MLETPPAISRIHAPGVTSPGLSALLSHAAFAPLPDLGFLRITGDDRVRWLNGMATNAIQALTPGEGCYNFFLNAQGRIQGDATAWLLEDSILLETQRDRIPALLAHLDHFIIMDDVELAESPATAGLLLAGPSAPGWLLDHHLATQPLHRSSGLLSGFQVDIMHAHSPLIPRYELWSDPETIANLASELAHDGTAAATPEDLEQLRLLEGTPRYGTDIRDKELPQETAQDARALHFAKGCYLGQEIVERIRSRGSVHRTFSGFLLTGETPPAGTPLFTPDAPEKPIGELTSATRIQLPESPITLALGYIRREALTKTITYASGTATPTSLPYRS